jgi:hypothetical protein
MNIVFKTINNVNKNIHDFKSAHLNNTGESIIDLIVD